MKTEDTAKTAAPSFNPLKFIKVCLKSWKTFLISIIVCTGLAGVYAYLKTPVYEVDAQLMLKDGDGGGMMMYSELARSFSLGDMFGMSSSTDNEVAVLQSHAVFLKTVQDLGLNVSIQKRVKFIKWMPIYTDCPLAMEMPPMLCDTLSVPLVFKFNRHDNGSYDITMKAKKKTVFEADDKTMPCTLATPYGDFTFSQTEYFEDETASSAYKISIGSYDAAAEAWADLVTIFAPNRKTDFIALSVTTSDPDFGKKLLDTIISNYNDLGNDEKNVRNNSSLRLVTDRLATLTEEMATTEQKLEEFKKSNKLTEVEYDAQYVLGKRADLESALLKAQTETEILRLTLDFIKDDANKYELVPDLMSSAGKLSGGSETARSQISTYNDLILERMRIVGSAKESNTALRLLDEQISALRANIVVSVQRAYDNAMVDLAKVKTETDKAEGRISDLPSLERQYLEIRRMAELQNQLYLFLLQQKEEISLNMASRSQSAVTIDEPHVLAEPVGLTKTKVLILGFLIGGLLPLLLVYFVRMRRAPLSSDDEIRDASQAPMLASIRQETDSSLLPVHSRESANAETFRRLRSDLLLVLDQCKGSTVTVTSPGDGDGKSFVAVNLALSLAMIGKHTLLVDGALHSPAVASMLGIENPANTLSEYAAGSEDIEIRDVRAGAYTLDVLTAHHGGPMHPADVLASGRTAQIFEDLKKRYDCIVIDSAPLKGHSDAYDWAPISDVTLVVVCPGVTTPDDITTINTLYSEGRLPRIALVANNMK